MSLTTVLGRGRAKCRRSCIDVDARCVHECRPLYVCEAPRERLTRRRSGLPGRREAHFWTSSTANERVYELLPSATVHASDGDVPYPVDPLTRCIGYSGQRVETQARIISFHIHFRGSFIVYRCRLCRWSRQESVQS